MYLVPREWLDTVINEIIPLKTPFGAEEAIKFYSIEVFEDLFTLRKWLDDENISIIENVGYFWRDLAELMSSFRDGYNIIYETMLDWVYLWNWSKE